jgi:phosphoinositide-3-kinase, regulatory subunit 4
MPIYDEVEDGAVIFLSLICASIRNTLYPSSRLYALDLLLAIGEHLTDEIRLDRLAPYMIALLGDEFGLVRAGTMKALTQLVSMCNMTKHDGSTHRYTKDHFQ